MPISRHATPRRRGRPPQRRAGPRRHRDARRCAHAIGRVPALQRRQLVGAEQQHQVAVAGRGQLAPACRPCTTGPRGRSRCGTARAPDRRSRTPRPGGRGPRAARAAPRGATARRSARSARGRARAATRPRWRAAGGRGAAGCRGSRGRRWSLLLSLPGRGRRASATSPMRISSPSRTPARRSAPMHAALLELGLQHRRVVRVVGVDALGQLVQARDAEPALLAQQPVAHAAAGAGPVHEVVGELRRRAGRSRRGRARSGCSARDQVADALARRAGDARRPAAAPSSSRSTPVVGLQLARSTASANASANAARSSGGAGRSCSATTMRGRSARPWPCAASSP